MKYGLKGMPAGMGVRRGRAKRAFPPLWKLRLRSKNFWKMWNQQFYSD